MNSYPFRTPTEMGAVYCETAGGEVLVTIEEMFGLDE